MIVTSNNQLMGIKKPVPEKKNRIPKKSQKNPTGKPSSTANAKLSAGKSSPTANAKLSTGKSSPTAKAKLSAGKSTLTANDKLLSKIRPSGKREESFFELVYEVARQIPYGRVTS